MKWKRFKALLYEISLVTVPAYKDTQVEARSWEITPGGVILPDNPANLQVLHPLNRWRP